MCSVYSDRMGEPAAQAKSSNGRTPVNGLTHPHSDIVKEPEMSVAKAGARWYLLQCKARQDVRALQNLTRQGFTCYWPTRPVERRRAGEHFVTEEPLFPGYGFIRLDCVNDCWSTIRSTRGVLQLVRFNDYPTPICDQIIDSIRARIARAVVPQPYLRPGERVQIVEGAFAQLEAIFLTSDGEARVMLLLNIVQHDQALSFPIHAIRKVG